MDIAKLAFWNQFTNGGLLLFSIYAIGQKLREDLVVTYAFLLKQRRIVPFNYAFYFHSLPRSEKGSEDLYSFAATGDVLLTPDDYVEITEKGEEWAKQYQTDPEFGKAVTAVKDFLARYNGWSDEQLVETCKKALSW